MKTEESKPIALLVSEGNRTRSARLSGLREAVVEALATLDVRMVFTDRQHVSHYGSRIDGSRRLVVIAESSGAINDVFTVLGHGVDATYCLLVAPSVYSNWGSLSKEWTDRLAVYPGQHLVYLTDSDLSRTMVEQHLNTIRADVRVVEVDETVVEGSEPDGLSFRLPFWYEASSWDFKESVSYSVPTASESSRAKRLGSNISTLEGIVAARIFEGAPIRIGILGHKLSFIDELSRDLSHASGSPVDLDEWTHLGAPSNVSRAKGIVARSDVIIGEWGRPNNVWIQEHATPDKRLIVRVHRYEVTTDFPNRIDMHRYSAGVVIVPWVGRALVQKFGWPEDKMVYIPNYVNTRYFYRPKLPGSEFVLGMVGITPDLKRLDLALDILRSLREEDPRFILRVRGDLPTAHLHWGQNLKMSHQWGSILHRLRLDPLLRNAVFFDPSGRDMASWFEGIGVILSTSDLEGSHVALAEGMASGALPIVRPWPGARTLWPSECIFDRVDMAVQRILSSRDPKLRSEIISQMLNHPALDQNKVLRAWWDLVKGNLNSAQEAFGPIDWQAEWYAPVDY